MDEEGVLRLHDEGSRGRGPRHRRSRRRIPGTKIAISIVAVVAVTGAGWWQWNRSERSLPRPFTVAGAASGGSTGGSSGGSSAGSTSTTSSSSLSSPSSSGLVIGGGPWPAGQCLFWDQTAGQNPRRESRSVACDQTHLIEITGSVDLTARFATYPNQVDFETIRGSDCGAFAHLFLGVLVDPVGRFALEELIPTPQDWNAGGGGARTLWCGIGAAQHVATSNPTPLVFPPFTGEARGASQKFLYGTGTCLTTAANGDIEAIVACSGPHVLEVTGSVDVTGRATTNPTAADSKSSLLSRLCAPLTRTHLRRSLRPDEGPGWIPISPVGWDAGERIVECTVARFRGNNPVSVTGPLAGAP